MSPFLRTATGIAFEAGKILLRHSKQLDRIKVWQKSPNNPVSNTDLECEQEIVNRLRRAYPEHGIITEENTVNKVAQTNWIIDPLDGTRNFIQGISHFAISMALVNREVIELGLVYDPIKDELFSAEKGEGATLNRMRIRASEHKTIAGSCFATGIPYRSEQDAPGFLKALEAMITQGANIRRMGAASLDLCYVACGRFDGFWESGLQQWDIAAGMLIVQEAKGVIGNLRDSEQPVLESGNILATNSHLFKKSFKLLQ